MLPKILYIYKHVGSSNEEESWFVASEEIKDCADRHGSTVVGTYELKETWNVTLVVKTELKIEPA